MTAADLTLAITTALEGLAQLLLVLLGLGFAFGVVRLVVRIAFAAFSRLGRSV